MQGLTRRQQEILDMIRACVADSGLPPTRADICSHFGFRSLTAADDHLKALARKGVIELVPGTSRGIRLCGPDPGAGLPLVGRVAAGEPLLAAEHIEEYYRLDESLFTPPADYLLRVHGMSMKDAGILDGDLLAVHATPVAHQRQIVVARIGDEVTVKRFTRRGNIVTLLAENPDFAPIRVDLRTEEFHIEGISVGIIRRNDT
ncbi:transcriptional repressor LexA [Granulosicoccaceae sp. 1_MG-2023]|nr:transcriptional repressor LexA [Granulosicoccaceae sp. 1_MG-2023]